MPDRYWWLTPLLLVGIALFVLGLLMPSAVQVRDSIVQHAETHARVSR